MNKHIITFSIGDWSDDGHGKQEEFSVESSLPVEELRELYFAQCDKLKVRLDGHDERDLLFPIPANDYDAGFFPGNLYDHLVSKGVKMPRAQDEEGEDEDRKLYFVPEQFLQIVLEFIKTGNSKFKYKVIKKDSFYFYGEDKKKRHIGYFGYGLFH